MSTAGISPARDDAAGATVEPLHAGGSGRARRFALLLAALVVPLAVGGLAQVLGTREVPWLASTAFYVAQTMTAGLLLATTGLWRTLACTSSDAGRALGLAALRLAPWLVAWLVLADGRPTHRPDSWSTQLVLLVPLCLAAVGEELQLRGLVQPAAAALWGGGPAVWVGAVLFALLHLHAAPLYLLPVYLADGLLLGVLRQRSGSVLPGLVVHLAVNLATGLLLVDGEVPGWVVGAYAVAVVLIDVSVVLHLRRRAVER